MHLIVVMHGMWGSTRHMNEIVQAIQEKYNDSLVYNCPVNTFFYTFQGIDVCGWRLKQNLEKYLQDWAQNHSTETIDSISFIGYSAGGLFNRYCIGLLYQENFFKKVKPIHFITIATPHLGIRNNSRISSGRLMNLLADNIVMIYAGRTGKQLALVDGTATETPLLLEMSLPNTVFYKGLSLFPHIFIYANGRADNTVPFCTSSLSQRNTYKYGTQSLSPKEVDPQTERLAEKVESTTPTSTSSSALLTSRYKFLVCQERIDSDRAIIPPTKPMEYDIYQTLKYLILLLVFSPLLIFHCLFFLIAIRIPSLCYSFPLDWEKYMISRKPQADGVVHKDICPLLILRHLRELPIYRVVAVLPGPHTHGTIICRSWKNNGGMEVITHLVEDVLSLGLIENSSNHFQEILENSMTHTTNNNEED